MRRQRWKSPPPAPAIVACNNCGKGITEEQEMCTALDGATICYRCKAEELEIWGPRRTHHTGAVIHA